MAEEEIVEKGYDRIADKYYVHRHIFDNREELEKFIGMLPENSRVLDVGCGAGIPVKKRLVEAGFDVTGVDISEVMLNLARKNVPEAFNVKSTLPSGIIAAIWIE